MNNIDRKIEKLMGLTMQFIFIEYYTHTGKAMYKILNPYTNYREEKLVLCFVSAGIEKALDLACHHLKYKQKTFFGNKHLIK